MATSLSANVTAGVTFELQNVLTGATPSAQGNMSFSAALTNGTTAGKADLIYYISTTLAGAGTATYDLYGTLTNFWGSTISMAKLNFMFVKLLTTTAATSISIGNATNALDNWISDATKTIKINNGGVFMLGDSGTTGYPVVDGATDAIMITNGDAVTTATYEILFIGKSA